jgi:hypothetical protein
MMPETVALDTRHALGNLLTALQDVTEYEAGTVIMIWQGNGGYEESTLLVQERRALIALRQATAAMEKP